jgi:Protein of unknown function
MTMSTIHITNGDVAADSLRKALDQARRTSAALWPCHTTTCVVSSTTAFSAFACCSSDTPQVRADFWGGVIGDTTRDFLAELTLRRVCFHLREMPQRLNEVRLSIDDLTGDASAPLHRPDRATSAGMFAPDLLQKRLRSAAPISVLRIGRLALEWQEVKVIDAELRRWHDNTFTTGTFAELDARIFEHAVDGWQPAGRVAAYVMAADNGLLVSDSLVLWRLRELAAAGQLQLRGDADDWRSLEMHVTRTTLSPV